MFNTIYLTIHRWNPPSGVPRHVISDPVIVQETLYASHRRNGDILIPQLPPCEIHHILLADTPNHPLNFLRIHSSACRDDLATNVFCDRGGTV